MEEFLISELADDGGIPQSDLGENPLKTWCTTMAQVANTLIVWLMVCASALGIRLFGKSRNFFTAIESWASFTQLELMHLIFFVLR